MSTLVRVQLAIFVVLTVVGVSIAGVRYAGIGTSLFGGSYVVQADFARSGGIFEGAEVTYRGVMIGRVGPLEPTSDGVLVSLELDEGTRIPVDTTATVANRSAIGEQYVDLRPQDSEGPYLQPGQVITRDRTDTPISTNTLLFDLDQLIDSVPKDDLVTVIDELGAAFEGTGRDLSRIVDAGNALIRTADANVEETIGLIEHSETVLATQRESGSAIKSFSKDLAGLSDTLADPDTDADIRTVLDSGVRASTQMRKLVEENASDVPLLLSNLATTGQIVRARLDGVRHVLILYPYVVRGGYTVVDKDPKTGHYTAHFGLQLASGPRACREGYGSTDKRQPGKTEEREFNTEAHCGDEETTMRSAGSAPDAEESSARSGSKPGSGSGSGAGSGRSAKPIVAPYDPRTGEVQLPDGRTVRAGGRGGQQRTFGEDSWKWLLIGPLAR